jgi:enterochelin esterase family protein
MVLLFAACGLIALTVVAAADQNADSDEVFDSPRLAALAKRLIPGAADKNREIVDEFLNGLQGKGPLVEPSGDDPHASWITFLWRGNERTRRMNVQGGPATGDFAPKMARLAETDLWYRTDRIPNDSRFTYFFQVNRPLRFPPHSEKLPPLSPPLADPLNPHKLSNPDRSLVEMLDAPPQPWITRQPNVAKGTLKEHQLQSNALTDTQPHLDSLRKFWVYTPAGYDSLPDECRLLVMFDGSPNIDPAMPVPVILDNLIAEKKLPPLVAVFVYQTAERDREVGCSEPFGEFIASELVPWVQKHYRVASAPHRTIVGGMSGGGLMAGFCGLRHSDVFGNVLSLSGGFGWWPGSFDEKLDEEPGWLTRQFVTAPPVPVRFFLAAGQFENYFFPYNLLVENRRLRDVLLAKGHDVRYVEFSGRHDPVCWRGPFVEGLIWLTKN